ncbi:MAG: DUF1015 domain-containing protein [Actinobacteria bacterium]|nr:DUF1015 domain-containing protein [Actinomycetota bacterium]
MPTFKPFRGIRYDTTRSSIDAVTAPPYDVIDADARSALVARDPHNIVRVDLPDEAEGPDRYRDAARTLDRWLADAVLVRDTEEAFYVYRMDYTDESGEAVHTLGVLGALELSRPDEGSILPHEHTTPKAKSDRLDLLRATRTNLSAIWGLSLASGLTEACRLDRDPDESWSDPDGVTHSLWVLDDPAACDHIAELVAPQAIVIADGHHRYETSLAYRDERTAAGDDPAGAADAMVFVVELTEDELTVRPIHRLVDGVSDTALREHLATWFDLTDFEVVDADTTGRMAEAGALTWVHPDGSGTFLRPIDSRFTDVDDLDSSRLAAALAGLAGARITYQHGTSEIIRAVTTGAAGHGFLLRPATVSQIRRNAHEHRRMPPKTTFFHPKPRTGPVLRPTD